MNVTRRCHYLPQFYLSYFTNRDGKLIVYNKSKPESEPNNLTPINTCVEKDLYNIKKDDGTIDDSIETKILAPIESEASSIINEIIYNDKKLTVEMIPPLAIFIAFMLTRVPNSIEAAMELGKAIQIHHIKELANNPEEIQRFLDHARKEGNNYNDITVERLQDEIKNFEEKYDIEMNKKYATGMSLQPTFELFKILLDMNWCLFRAPTDSFFITSDAPAVCFVLKENGSAMFGGALSLKKAEVTFPLSPNKCLHIDRVHTQKYRAISSKFVKEINKRTAWSANRMIISHKKFKYLKALNIWAAESLRYPKIDTNWMIEYYKSIKTN